MIEIRMPQLGETVTEGVIAGWRKQVGDAVAADETVCEVATDKVTFEVPAIATGVLAEILAPEGAVVLVGAVIARLQTTSSATAAASPVPEPAGHSDTVAGQSRARLSPLVRRLANETGIDPATVSGSGLGGRVTRDDLLRAVAERDRRKDASLVAGSSLRPDLASAASTADLKPAFPVLAMAGDERAPFSPMRQATARHMVHSVHTAPHGFIGYEIDYGAIEAVRSERKAAFRAANGVSLTFLPFVIRAAALALREFPRINASVEGDALILRKAVNIGVAVDLSHQGLVVPVVRDADTLTVAGIGRAVADLAARARAGRLEPDDLSGGTFTVTNPGASGTYISIPIINQPQVAILVTDGVRKQPSVVTLEDGTDAFAIRSKGFIGLSMDHRAFDGAYAAEFLSRLKSLLEERDWRGDL